VSSRRPSYIYVECQGRNLVEIADFLHVHFLFGSIVLGDDNSIALLHEFNIKILVYDVLTTVMLLCVEVC